MSQIQYEILHALKSAPRGSSMTAIQIRRRCPSISPSLAAETLARMIETTEGVRLVEPPQVSPSGRIVFSARWALSS
jgi:hypothetical protein